MPTRPTKPRKPSTRVTDVEREQIAGWLREGRSRTEIRRLSGRGAKVIQQVADAIGFKAPEVIAAKTATARECRSAFSAERRAVIAARLTEESERLLDSLHEPHVAFNFGGKDNDYNERLMSEPPVADKRQIIAAVAEAQRTVLAIDRHDNAAEEGAAAVDSWLRSLVSEATSS